MGFDRPLSDIFDDKLSRRNLTRQLYSYLTNLEKDWSVRVGLLAPWGEGKTTISEWILRNAEEDGHVAFLYSPWSAKTDCDIFAGLYVRLVKELDRAKIKISKKVRVAGKSFIARLRQTDSIKALTKGDASVSATFDALQSALSATGADLANLTENLPADKRIIIIVDDIDRVEKTLIPHLLLSLREVMDIPQFSFVLPFDDEIVSHALKQYGGSEEYGRSFLEKVLDYRLTIEPAKRDDLVSLFKSELEKYCPFFDIHAVDGVESILPSNPRKLKYLVRSLRLYEQEADRHTEAELSWKAVLFGQLIKTESIEFFRQYYVSTFPPASEEGVVPPWYDIGGDEADPETARLEQILEEVKVRSPQKRARIKELCMALYGSFRASYMHQVEYAWRIIDEPEKLTWGEFEILWESWQQNQNEQVVLDWLDAHTSESTDRVIIHTELIDTIAKKYNEILDKASWSVLQSEHTAKIEQARLLLSLLSSVTIEPVKGFEKSQAVTFQHFKFIIDPFLNWVHFDGNEEDQKLRMEELGFLERWIDVVNELGCRGEYSDYLTSLTNAASLFGPKDELAKKLAAQLIEKLEYDSNLELLELVSSEHGISSILHYNDGFGVKGLLLRSDSAFWLSGDPDAPGMKLFSSAANNPALQKRALDFMDLIMIGAKEGTQELNSQEVSQIFKCKPVMQLLWNTAIATPLQYRRLSSLRELHSRLVSYGIAEDELEFPDWLKRGMNIGKKKR